MPVSRDHLDRFLRAVQRRWIVMRAAESAGLAVLGGCGLALLVLPILLWRGEPALPVVLSAIAVAAAAGLVAGFLRRPDLFSAAAEADRQLDLADLLCTALLTRARSGDDEWAALVVAAADARCRTLAPGAVVLNRLGGRAWGGIGLSTALVLTLGVMSVHARSTEAIAAAAAPKDLPAELRVASPRERTASAHPAIPGQPQHRSAGAARETTEQQGDSDSFSPSPASAVPRMTRGASGSDGGGPGLATSSREANVSRPELNPSVNASPTHPAGNESGGGRGTLAAQTGTDADDALRDEGSRMASPTDEVIPAPAWHSSAWSEAREQAHSAVRDGRVPDAYRDLVRHYFDEPRQ